MNTSAIIGGVVATEYGVTPASLLIRDGVIAAIFTDERDLPSTDERIDAQGLVVLPGGVDPHCHLREPGTVLREGWRTGSMAAAAGGVTTVLEYPQAEPPVTDVETLHMKRQVAESESVIDFGLWGGAIEAALPHIEAMHDAGVVGFKAFMHTRNVLFPGIDDGVVLDVLEQVAKLGAIFSLHCENAPIQIRNIARMEADGHVQARAHAESRPPIVEYEAVARFLLLARSVPGARVHLPHVTLCEVGELLRQAKRERHPGLSRSVSPALLLDESELDRQGVWVKCGPPLRSRSNVNRLWDYVLDGTIDYHASDHAAATPEEKEAGLDNIFRASTGVINNQWAIPLVLDEAYHRRGMRLDQLAHFTATNAAKRHGLYPRKGAIRLGADADLVLYDLNGQQTIDRERQFNRHKWTPWHGVALGVRVARTIVRGRTVFDGERIVADAGYGQFVSRTYGSTHQHT